jgi:hypothetical protein
MAIMKEYLEKAMTYAEYLGLIDNLLADGKTTGTNQSEAIVGYGRLNRQRMKRLEKTLELGNEVVNAAIKVNRRQIWLILTEGWCGDAAQNIPVIEKIVAESDKIETRYILRDENLELMDGFLTNGARAIPKLIIVDAETLEVLDTWGSRPAPAQKLFYDLKDRGSAKVEISETLQRWYNEDHGRSLQAEFVEIMERVERCLAIAAV